MTLRPSEAEVRFRLKGDTVKEEKEDKEGNRKSSAKRPYRGRIKFRVSQTRRGLKVAPSSTSPIRLPVVQLNISLVAPSSTRPMYLPVLQLNISLVDCLLFPARVLLLPRVWLENYYYCIRWSPPVTLLIACSLSRRLVAARRRALVDTFRLLPLPEFSSHGGPV